MGGSSHAENQTVVEEQKKQAADAAKKEADRQARLKTGLTKIGYAFEGKPILKATSHNFDWKGFNDKTKLPPGFTRVQVDAKGKPIPDTPGQAATETTVRSDPYRGPPEPGYGPAGPGTVSLIPGHAATAATPATGGTTMIMGPDGKLHKIGSTLTYSTNDPTGQVSGGFKDLENKYRDSYYNYYSADVGDQYAKAQQEAAFRLARAGLGVSSAANDVNVDLVAQNAKNLTGIANQADQAKGAFHDKIQAEKKQAVDQLYQTEDPTLAANTALASVRNLSVETPSLSPLADVFNIAAIGGANLLKNFNSQKAYNQFEAGLPQGAGSSHITGGS